jgi:hypothetical protein
LEVSACAAEYEDDDEYEDENRSSTQREGTSGVIL